MFQVDLQMAKCCLLDLPANLFANANPLSKQIRGFFRSSKNPWAKQNADGMYMWHFCGFLSTCSCIYTMYVQSMAGEDRMQWLIFRVWKASCCNLGDRQKLWLIQTSPFLSLCEMTWSVPYFCCDPLIHWSYLTRQFLFVHNY